MNFTFLLLTNWLAARAGWSAGTFNATVLYKNTHVADPEVIKVNVQTTDLVSHPARKQKALMSRRLAESTAFSLHRADAQTKLLTKQRQNYLQTLFSTNFPQLMYVGKSHTACPMPE